MDLNNPLVFGFARLDFFDSFRRTAPLQLLDDGPESVWRLRMPSAHVVIEIRGMVDKASRAHARDRSTQESS